MRKGLRIALDWLLDVPGTLHGIYLMLRELNQPIILLPPGYSLEDYRRDHP